MQDLSAEGRRETRTFEVSQAKDEVAMNLNPTEKRIQELLDRITYKPGWKLTVALPYWNGNRTTQYDPISISGTFSTVDVDTGMQIMLQLYYRIGPFYDDEKDGTLIQCIGYAIKHFEEHEFKEWFKIDGMCIYDPHSEEKRQTYQLQGVGL